MFQEALEEGVEHIVITDHLDMTSSPFVPDIPGGESMTAGVARVQETTLSIVVRFLKRSCVFGCMHIMDCTARSAQCTGTFVLMRNALLSTQLNYKSIVFVGFRCTFIIS